MGIENQRTNGPVIAHLISGPSISTKHTDTSSELLSSDLTKIGDWADKWLVTFQPPKTDSLVISRKINKPVHPPLFIQNQQIKKVDTHKHLGLHFSKDGSWHHQIQYIKDNEWNRINTMRKLKFKPDRKLLK